MAEKRDHYDEILDTAARQQRRCATRSTPAAASVRRLRPVRAVPTAADPPTAEETRPCPSRPLHVLIAGGGLAGLATAQGLLKSGHTVEVFERDADLNRKQGYYLHFNPLGGEALRRCLPDDLFELYLRDLARVLRPRRVDRARPPARRSSARSRTWARPTTGPRAHTGVHRRTLRQILSARLGDACTPVHPSSSFEQDADGVTVTLADGSDRPRRRPGRRRRHPLRRPHASSCPTCR